MIQLLVACVLFWQDRARKESLRLEGVAA
jgi:hypothetical protein